MYDTPESQIVHVHREHIAYGAFEVFIRPAIGVSCGRRAPVTIRLVANYTGLVELNRLEAVSRHRLTDCLREQ